MPLRMGPTSSREATRSSFRRSGARPGRRGPHIFHPIDSAVPITLTLLTGMPVRACARSPPERSRERATGQEPRSAGRRSHVAWPPWRPPLEPTPARAPSAVVTPSSGWRTTSTCGWPVPRPTGVPHLVPLSFDWDGKALLLATATDSPTGRNLAATRTVRLGLGLTRDVTMIEGEVEVLGIDAAAAGGRRPVRGAHRLRPSHAEQPLRLVPRLAAAHPGLARGGRAGRARPHARRSLAGLRQGERTRPAGPRRRGGRPERMETR